MNTARRVIEAAQAPGANLTSEEINQAYLNDYTGNLGVVKSVYLGPYTGSSDKNGHKYLALIDGEADDFAANDERWMVTHVFVSTGGKNRRPDALEVEFAGVCDFASDDRKAAEDFFNKEAHVKGGGEIKPLHPELAAGYKAAAAHFDQQDAKRRQ